MHIKGSQFFQIFHGLGKLPRSSKKTWDPLEVRKHHLTINHKEMWHVLIPRNIGEENLSLKIQFPPKKTDNQNGGCGWMVFPFRNLMKALGDNSISLMLLQILLYPFLDSGCLHLKAQLWNLQLMPPKIDFSKKKKKCEHKNIFFRFKAARPLNLVEIFPHRTSDLSKLLFPTDRNHDFSLAETLPTRTQLLRCPHQLPLKAAP